MKRLKLKTLVKYGILLLIAGAILFYIAKAVKAHVDKVMSSGREIAGE